MAAALAEFAARSIRPGLARSVDPGLGRNHAGAGRGEPRSSFSSPPTRSRPGTRAGSNNAATAGHPAADRRRRALARPGTRGRPALRRARPAQRLDRRARRRRHPEPPAPVAALRRRSSAATSGTATSPTVCAGAGFWCSVPARSAAGSPRSALFDAVGAGRRPHRPRGVHALDELPALLPDSRHRRHRAAQHAADDRTGRRRDSSRRCPTAPWSSMSLAGRCW